MQIDRAHIESDLVEKVSNIMIFVDEDKVDGSYSLTTDNSVLEPLEEKDYQKLVREIKKEYGVDMDIDFFRVLKTRQLPYTITDLARDIREKLAA